MPFKLDDFTRIVTDSKYQFSVGTITAILTMFPADRTTLLCVTALAGVTILAEGLRDFAKWLPVKPVDTVVQTGENPTAQSVTTPPTARDPYKRV